MRNAYLDAKIRYYDEHKTMLTRKMFTTDYLLETKAECPWLAASDSIALQSALEHVDAAYDHFFRNLKEEKKGKQAGFPRFAVKDKPSGSRYTTKNINGNIRLLQDGNQYFLKLPKLGLIPFVCPKGHTLSSLQPSGTRITSVSVQKEGTRFYAALQMEAVIDEITPVTDLAKDRVIACDMGISRFCTYGNENIMECVENPRWIRVHAKRVRRLQKSLSRKQKGSRNYEKAKARLRAEHAKVKNQRKDFHHKLSRKIVNDCDVFVCEDLNIKGMVKNHCLAREVMSCGWGQFLSFVRYKMERKGGTFVRVGRFFASSQLCHSCGYQNKELALSDRQWICPVCGMVHDRDMNAVLNLLYEGLRILGIA